MTRRRFVIYKTFDVVVVPFPFTDRLEHKNRPAIIVSSSRFFNSIAEYSVLAMITSADNEPWPLDVPIEYLDPCGLSKSSVIRMKLFTLDNRLIKQKIGSINKNDQTSLIEKWNYLFYDFHNNR